MFCDDYDLQRTLALISEFLCCSVFRVLKRTPLSTAEHYIVYVCALKGMLLLFFIRERGQWTQKATKVSTICTQKTACFKQRTTDSGSGSKCSAMPLNRSKLTMLISWLKQLPSPSWDRTVRLNPQPLEALSLTHSLPFGRLCVHGKVLPT